MRKIYFYLLALMMISKAASAQTYTWVGGASGDFQISTNWSPVRAIPSATDILSFNATSPILVANVSNQTIGAVAIASGTSAVTFTTNLATNILTLSAAIPLIYTTNGSILAGDFLTIRLNNSALFTMSSGTFGIAPSTGGKVIINKALVLAGGKLDFDVAGTGGTTITATGSIRNNSGIFSCSTVGAITWTTGSNYYHGATGAAASAIPTCTWQTGSTCTIAGMNGGTTAPTGFTPNAFANLTWDCPAQAGAVDLNLPATSVIIVGAFTIANTNGNQLRFGGAGGCTISAGSYAQTGGNIVLQTSSGTSTLSISNAFSHTGGSIEAVAGSAAGTGILDLKGDVTKGGATTWLSGSSSTASQMIFQLSGSVTQLVNIAGTWSAPVAGVCNITNSNTDLFGVVLTGTLQVINTNSGSAATCSMGGIISGSGSISYAGSGTGGTTLVYNGGSAQIPSAIEFPSSGGPKNLTISNSLGVNFPASFSRTVPGTLSLLNGNVSVGSGNTLSLTNTSLASQLVYFNGFITSGTLSRTFPTLGLPTNGATLSSRFPFGTGNNDRSVNVFFSGANLTGGSSGTIAVSHSAVINATAATIIDDITLNKRSNSSWTISSSGFSLGTGGEKISVTALATTIGQVSNIATLRLTDGLGLYGTTIATGGTVDAPLVGKSGLVVADIASKTLYVGSDNANALTIITYTWTGTINTDWTNPGNWTGGGAGYPSSSSEIADISSAPTNMPTINTGVSIQLYQLIVGAGVTLTMAGTASIEVTDNVNFAGSGVLSSSSTFIYSSAVNAQNIKSLTYGNLTLAGPAAKIFPATLTVTGQYTLSGAGPTLGTSTFIYAGAGSQRITAGNYYNLTITGNRGGNLIRLGTSVSPQNTIDINNVFDISTLSNFTVNTDFNTVNFSSSGFQAIPGFVYGAIRNVASGSPTRTFDPLGSTNAAHVISCITLSRGTAACTVTNSKVRFTPTGFINATYGGGTYHDLEFSGNMNGLTFGFFPNATFTIAGTFLVSLTNYIQGPDNFTIDLNGTGDQPLPAYKHINATSTPAFKYVDINIQGGNRNIILGGAGTDTINIRGALSTYSAFSAGKGFVVAGSTVNFSGGSYTVPVLTPVVAGGNNYNNLCVTGGTRILAGDIIAGGNVSVAGTDASPASLTIGDGTGNRTLTILGNLTVAGTSSSSANTGQLDFNTVSNTNKINLAGNLTISGTGQVTTGVGTSNGTIVFNGTTQQYNNTSIFKNGFVNFTIGNGTAATALTLNNSLDLVRSSSAPFGGIVSVENNATLNCGINNILIGTGATGNANFDLKAGATLVIANTGGIEGAATSASTGTILSGADITKTYSPTANYVLNGATTTPFPAAVTSMNNLTIGANVSLNRAIVASGTLDLAASTLTQASNDLQFSGLTSTTGSIAADKNSTLSISGSNGTVGTLRFAPGFNITGQFTIARPVTVALGSDLTIDKVPKTGNYISGAASSILDINGHTLTINGTISGPGTLSGSATSSLTLGGSGIIGTLNFTAGKTVLKNLTLNNSAKATLGTVLDITAGASPGNEGTVSITGTAVLTTGGNLTIKSNAFGTARVSQGDNAGAYISGDVTVERYIDGAPKRGWRLLGVPTYGQTIKQAWQENQPAGVNGVPGFGTIITSAYNDAAWAANGFDYQSNSYSLLKYNQGTNTWDGVPNTSGQLSASGANKAYMIFIRGDRTATPSNGPLSTATTLRTKGTLFQGNQPAVAVNAGQFGAIGNNFASAIDFTTVGDANIDQSFSVWDPKLVGAYGLGGYVTFSASNSWNPVPGGASYPSGVPNMLIQSGQAFIVHATGSTGNVTLKESGKATGSMMVFRPSAAPAGLATNLFAVSGADRSLADGNSVVFNNNFSNGVDNRDVLKPANFGENLGLLRDAKTLVIEARQSVVDTDTIFFSIKKLKKQNYQFELKGSGFDNSLAGFLEDKYLSSSTPLSLNGTTTVDFIVNNDAGSFAEDRFRVVFKAPVVLPVTIRTVSATKQSGGVQVEWKVENEINISHYEVERSADGRTFSSSKTVLPSGLNAAYSWLDVQPFTGEIFYRIKSTNTNGTISYSSIVKVSSAKSGAGKFTIYPNPVGEGVIGLQMKDIPAGAYTVRLLNSEGKVITKTIIQHNGGTSTQSVVPADKLTSGMYQLEITGADNKVQVLKVMVL